MAFFSKATDYIAATREIEKKLENGEITPEQLKKDNNEKLEKVLAAIESNRYISEAV